MKDGRHQVSLKSLASDQWVSNTVSGGDTVKVQLDKDLTVAGKKILQLEERRSSRPSRQMCAPPPLIQSLISARRPDWKSWAIERNKVEFQFRNTMLQEERKAGAV